MSLIELAEQTRKDRKVKKASFKVNKIRKEMNKLFDSWRDNGDVEDLTKAQSLKSELQQVMSQSLESLEVEVNKPDLPPITHGEEREKKVRERSRLLERIKTQEGEKKLKSARRLEKLNALLD